MQECDIPKNSQYSLISTPYLDMKETSASVLNTKFSVFESCMTLPLTRQRIPSLWGSREKATHNESKILR